MSPLFFFASCLSPRFVVFSCLFSRKTCSESVGIFTWTLRARTREILRRFKRFIWRVDKMRTSFETTVFNWNLNPARILVPWQNHEFSFPGFFFSRVSQVKMSSDARHISNDDWWIDAVEIDTIQTMSLDGEGGLWSSAFVPPPPRPFFLNDDTATDGVTTCDLCTWARHHPVGTDSLGECWRCIDAPSSVFTRQSSTFSCCAWITIFVSRRPRNKLGDDSNHSLAAIGSDRCSSHDYNN